MRKYLVMILSIFLLMSCSSDNKKVCLDELPAGIIINYNYVIEDSEYTYFFTIKTPLNIRKFQVPKDTYDYLNKYDTILNSKMSKYYNEELLEYSEIDLIYSEDTLEYKEKNLNNFIEK